jgi:hypothetical protein
MMMVNISRNIPDKNKYDISHKFLINCIVQKCNTCTHFVILIGIVLTVNKAVTNILFVNTDIDQSLKPRGASKLSFIFWELVKIIFFCECTHSNEDAVKVTVNQVMIATVKHSQWWFQRNYNQTLVQQQLSC